jgi:hypothetical protein
MDQHVVLVIAAHHLPGGRLLPILYELQTRAWLWATIDDVAGHDDLVRLPRTNVSRHSF